jgi:hypothetical protein
MTCVSGYLAPSSVTKASTGTMSQKEQRAPAHAVKRACNRADFAGMGYRITCDFASEACIPCARTARTISAPMAPDAPVTHTTCCKRGRPGKSANIAAVTFSSSLRDIINLSELPQQMLFAICLKMTGGRAEWRRRSSQ